MRSDTDITQFLEGLTIDQSECLHAGSDGVCISEKVLPAVAAVARLQVGEKSAADIVTAATEVLGCGSESCVISHARTQEAARALNIASDLTHELAHKFKPPGPRNSTALLSNVHIDSVLKLWAEEFPDFYACPFAMADFNTNGDHFAAVKLEELRREKCRTFGCVMNTDNSRGPGTHWVAVFVDMRPEAEENMPWTIEYFNSAGRPPAAAVVRWMEQTRAKLTVARAKLLTLQARSNVSGATAGPVETWAVSSVSHQRSQTECGPYALYYIRRRLEGAQPKDFMDASYRIPDRAMVEFRHYLFRERK
jgi:hypothetical protein